MAKDFYEDMTQETKQVLDKQQQYVNLALENGDAAYIEKPGQVTIKIRIKKGDSDADSNS